MKKELKGTRTELNLLKAYQGESEARNKYTYFASKSKKDGFVHISKVFEETANNEKEHAKVWFKLLHNIDTTQNNLLSSIKNESYEAHKMYPQFAKEAREEGFDDIAVIFENIAKVEAFHEKRYRALYEYLKNNKIFLSDKETDWICLNCGYIHNSKIAPETCPACSHKQAYFTRLNETY